MTVHDIEIRDAGRKGMGVFARRAFRSGEFIFRRRHGRSVEKTEETGLSKEDRSHLCEVDAEHSVILLPPGCYLNHSCDPNALRSGTIVFARRPIHKGDEITIDYRLNSLDAGRWKCLCGSVCCNGVVQNDFFSLPPERQVEYLPFAPAFVVREYRRRHQRRSTTSRVKESRGTST